MTRVLVVDDSITVRKLLEMALQPAGYALDFADSGQSGIARARAAPPDLILLDFVLPDMRGPDVCEALARVPALAKTPILLMSGRPEKARAKLAGVAQVVDFIGKPFTAEEIAARVAAALGGARGAAAMPSATRRGLSHGEREQVARAIYARIRDRLAQVPMWAAQLGSADPAPYVARRLLTPDVIDALLEALAPHCAPTLGAPPASDEPPPTLGDAAAVPVIDLLRALAMTGRGGEIAVGQGPERRLLYLRRGKVVFATCFDPTAYLERGARLLDGVAANARAHAEAEQRRSGKPAPVTLAHEGHLTGVEALVHERSRAILDQVIGCREGSYAFRDGAPPAWVEKLAQPIAIPQAILEHMRRAPERALVEQAVPALDVVLDRAAGFSRKIAELDLEPDEQVLVALVDGRTSVAALLERAATPPAAGLPVLARLIEIGLCQRRGSAAVREALRAERRRVVILDHDTEGFSRVIAEHLRRIPGRLEVLAVPPDAEALATATAARPSLVVVSAEEAGGIAEALAGTFSASEELAAVPLVAVLDRRDAVRVETLERAGFDRVLFKPVHMSEIDVLLTRAE